MDDERYFGTHIREVIGMVKDFKSLIKGKAPQAIEIVDGELLVDPKYLEVNHPERIEFEGAQLLIKKRPDGAVDFYVEPEICYHPELVPTQWEQERPEPTVMVGTCEHNMSCPVCGYGWGCAPDPCDTAPEKVKPHV